MRPADDHYPTPPEVTRALMRKEMFHGEIWEPCAGAGEMAEVLRTQYKVYATTLAENGQEYGQGPMRVRGGEDFLAKLSPPLTINSPASHISIVTNPPFRIAEQVIRRAIEVGPIKIAMLLNIRFLGSRKRKEGLFAEHPPKRIWVFCDRPSMYPADWEGEKGTTTETFSWWIWEWPFEIQKPELGWLDSREFVQ